MDLVVVDVDLVVVDVDLVVVDVDLVFDSVDVVDDSIVVVVDILAKSLSGIFNPSLSLAVLSPFSIEGMARRRRNFICAICVVRAPYLS